MKKKQNLVSLAEGLSNFVDKYGYRNQVKESQVIDAWHAQMGDFVKNMTETIFVKNQVLYVRLTSPAFKSEFSYGKAKIIAHINESLGEEYLKDVHFI
ncbi:DUF721 domain-containing protein [Ornithobacterium rhinotracheale]|uniref:DUF721 domain-containing protein n=1 Tax=Ornithobacterium rhinotracheale TaxID=28251 RepID=UPI00129CC784|nr:DUF721 domain-containing protein [Ornithobacterium rhinotracheale]MCK0205641.1 DUF721 domain-containing protein [Ornithobacterium rhinotracheale]MRJ09193.1 DUF721 domain-containing protein [Ornithobacterium rhinotracheale]UOH77002.1 DUF721 domain-containing protein [Ornithobacterium rhinotracheale]